MVSSELSDQKPGVITAFRVLLVFLSAGALLALILFLTRGTNTYDTDRVAKRYANLKKLHEEDTKKTSEYAVLDQAKGVYQLPVSEAVNLTVTDLSAIKPHAAYPVATPAPAAPAPAPAASPSAAKP